MPSCPAPAQPLVTVRCCRSCSGACLVDHERPHVELRSATSVRQRELDVVPQRVLHLQHAPPAVHAAAGHGAATGQSDAVVGSGSVAESGGQRRVLFV
jgi:hypothetical protein